MPRPRPKCRRSCGYSRHRLGKPSRCLLTKQARQHMKKGAHLDFLFNRLGISLADFLSDKISPEPTTGCWLWTGSVAPNGYGKTSPAYQGTAQAHRTVYLTLRGGIPNGLQLDHLCRTRSCVNPDHLEPVDNKRNAERGLQANKTHCPRGHPYDALNTYRARSIGRPSQFKRVCRKCHLAAVKLAQQRKRDSALQRASGLSLDNRLLKE